MDGGSRLFQATTWRNDVPEVTSRPTSAKCNCRTVIWRWRRKTSGSTDSAVQYRLHTQWRNMTGEAMRSRPYATMKYERKHWLGGAVSSPYAMTKDDGWSDEIASNSDDADTTRSNFSLTVSPSSGFRPPCCTISAKQSATVPGQLFSVAGL